MEICREWSPVPHPSNLADHVKGVS